MSCWSAPGREDKEDPPEEKVQEDDGEVVEDLSGRKMSDVEPTRKLEENSQTNKEKN